MNLREIRLDARNALRESRRSPLRDTLVYYLLTSFLMLVVSLLYYALDRAVAGAGGGLHASGARSAYSMANAALYIASLSVSVVSVFLEFGYKSVMLLRVRRKAVTGRDLRAGFRMFGRVLCLAVLTAVYITLWSCLFLLPGLVAAYRYRLAPYVLCDHPELSASQALRESTRLTRGRKLTLFRLDLSFWYYYIPVFIASMLSGVDTVALICELYGIPGFPALTYEQTLAIYAAGMLLLGVCYCWKLAHVTASVAGVYDRLQRADAAQQPQYPPLAPEPRG